MKASTKDQAKGKLERLKGGIKELVGKATGRRQLEAEGKDQTLGGKAQEKLGQVKKVLGALRRVAGLSAGGLPTYAGAGAAWTAFSSFLPSRCAAALGVGVGLGPGLGLRRRVHVRLDLVLDGVRGAHPVPVTGWIVAPGFEAKCRSRTFSNAPRAPARPPQRQGYRGVAQGGATGTAGAQGAINLTGTGNST